jgi:SpoIID/LytB domain protein
MRLTAATVASLLALAAGSSAAAPKAISPVSVTSFLITGGGWGHGVGMSQWGAHGQALSGRTYREILAYYYRGTELGEAPVANVRVLLREAKAVKISSPVPFRVRDAAGTRYELPAGELRLGPRLRVLVEGKLTPLPGPLVFRAGKGAQLSLGGVAYRGELLVRGEADRVQAINVLGLEAYLRGVVPREMPKHWPLEALKAQAVAARSYALARFLKGKPFNLYADWRSQIYGGVPAEAPIVTEAIRATAGQVVLYGGAVATTFFFSSSGGRTANGGDVFGLDLPYLVSVPDPWDESSPNHVWPPRVLTGAAIAKAFGLAAAIADLTAEPTPSGRPRSVALYTRAGATRIATAVEVRERLRLLSFYFQIGVLRLERPTVPAAPGAPVRLSGVARDVDELVLERLDENGVWMPATRPTVLADGSFAVVVRPSTTVRYRLSANGLPGPVVVVRVTPDDGA